ncbi:MAG TPA: flagellar FliJ family protein [Myxococcota bacterium]|nr:flagellar FliJ family protein [Myxococcota bacterium]
MPAFPPYRLQTLLEIRERKKEAAERHLSACFAALKVEKDKLAEMELELERMIHKRETRRREYLEKAMKGEVAAGHAVHTNKYIERLKELEVLQKEAIEGQKAVVRQREEDVEEARKALVVATQELKALEKHKEKWIEQVKKEIAAKEEDVMDELAQTIYMRNQRGE